MMNIERLSVIAAALLVCGGSALAQASERKGYIVQLADAPAATYQGTVSGLAATQPAPGSKLDVRAAHVQNYLNYLASKRAATLAKVPQAPTYYQYGIALNGFAARLTASEVNQLRADPSVLAITPDVMRKMDTVSTPRFLGIDQPGGAWSRQDALGRPIKGEDVIIGHVDGGVWPENLSFSDKVDGLGNVVAANAPGASLAYQPLPAGRYLGNCQATTGALGQSFTAANCNNKLIGAQYFNAGWKGANAPTWEFEYLDSPRDPDGHGTHTLSTSGGNANSPTPSGALISGIAPRARVAAYRVCYSGPGGPDATTGNGCFPSDSVAAINKAVADKVDVINFSISGSQTTPRDAVGEAFKNAAAAGVFVSASAGNSGPANAVAHLGTWLTTVGSSTHGRLLLTTITLGNGYQATGYSQFQGNVAMGPLPVILASEAGVAGADPVRLGQCFAAADNSGLALLDPIKVAGKIVVCDRNTSGGNARVNKSLAVFQAGGLGMIQTNTNAAQTLVADIHSVPSVHLPLANRAAVHTYAGGGLGTVSFSASAQDSSVIAPTMSDFSSRGPNKGDANVLKPDITAPGSDIYAAYGNRANATTAKRNAIIAGTESGDPAAASISGTSMAAPHVAGAAALLKQANPTWSPYAIKSALMTSALQSVKLVNGAVDPNRWGYGAGHLNPNGALDTKLVFDSSNADHQAYFNNTKAGGSVNLASITRSDIALTATVQRTVTNKGNATVTYTTAASLPGFTIAVSPSQFTLAPGASQSFAVTMTKTDSIQPEVWSFGELVFNGSDGSSTRSPVSAKALGVVATSEVTDTRAVGNKTYTAGLGYNGRVVTVGTGMVGLTAAINSSFALVNAANQGATFCFNGSGNSLWFDVAAGSKLLSVRMFDSETGGGASTDFDLVVQRNSAANGSGTWSTVGESTGLTSEETVNLALPQSGKYRLCFRPWWTGLVSQAFRINRWVVGPTVAPATLRALGAGSVTAGGVATLAVAWNTPSNVRSAGLVEYRTSASSPTIGTTVVFVDPVSVPQASVAAVAKLMVDKSEVAEPLD
ncbi:MAG TPA: S8 family serine peptidase [Rubrivivax sp.]|nr:S8 family serine peptidase [Rubrivivax sp.]